MELDKRVVDKLADFESQKIRFFGLRDPSYQPVHEEVVNAKQRFMFMTSQEFKEKFNISWNILFPYHEKNRKTNHQKFNEVIWDNPNHYPESNGIFSNGDIRNSSTNIYQDRQAKTFIQNYTEQSNNQFTAFQRNSGANLLTMLNSGNNTTANNKEKANLIEDEKLIMQASAKIPEFYGKDLHKILQMISENPALSQKLIDQISISANDVRNINVNRINNDNELRQQYMMAIQHVENSIIQYDIQYQYQHTTLSKQLKDLVTNQTPEQLEKLSSHIKHYQTQLLYLSANAKAQRQMGEIQLNLWKTLSEKPKLLPFTTAKNAVAQQIHVHQRYIRQQQIQVQQQMMMQKIQHRQTNNNMPNQTNLPGNATNIPQQFQQTMNQMTQQQMSQQPITPQQQHAINQQMQMNAHNQYMQQRQQVFDRNKM